MPDAAYGLIAIYGIEERLIKSGTKNWVIVGTSRQWAVAHGCAYEAYVYKTDLHYAFYARLENVDRTKVGVMRQVGATMCGNNKHLFNAERPASVYDHYFQVGLNARTRYATYAFEYTVAQLTRERITQHHHLHVRVKDLFGNHETLRLTGLEGILATHLVRFTDIESSHATFWVYWYSLDDDMQNIFIGMVLEYAGIHTAWLKHEGSCAKQMQGHASYDLSKIFEMNVLVNRISSVVDWDAEKAHRLMPNVAEVPYEDVRRIAAQMFTEARMEGKRGISTSWKDYWSQRVASVPGGAVHSRYERDAVYINAIERTMRSKKSVAATMPEYTHNIFMDRTPQIEAHTSTKYEWGKVRALYSCDLTSHMNADFGMIECENTFPFYVPTGCNANASYVKTVLEQVSDAVPFCYDFDDFNSQHSKASMQAVILAWLDVFGRDLTEEQRQSVVWTAESCNNMTVKVTETGDWYEAAGTLFSGWRLTTFVNTALNYVYLRHAGIHEQAILSVHNGDDVYAGLRNLRSAAVIVAATQKLNIRANVTKMSIGTIAEFLRMDMRAKKPSMVQYLTRACATFVHSRVESESPLSYVGLLRSYQTRADEIIERGGKTKLIRKLLRKQRFFASRLFGVDPELQRVVCAADEVAGGIQRDGDIGPFTLDEVAVGEDRVNKEKYLEMFDGAINSYTTYMKNLMPSARDYIEKRQIVKSMDSMFNFGRTSVVKEPASRGELYERKALRGNWKNVKEIRIMHKVRQGVTNTVAVMGKVAPAYADILARSGNPVLWLGILTK